MAVAVNNVDHAEYFHTLPAQITFVDLFACYDDCCLADCGTRDET